MSDLNLVNKFSEMLEQVPGLHFRNYYNQRVSSSQLREVYVKELERSIIECDALTEKSSNYHQWFYLYLNNICLTDSPCIFSIFHTPFDALRKWGYNNVSPPFFNGVPSRISNFSRLDYFKYFIDLIEEIYYISGDSINENTSIKKLEDLKSEQNNLMFILKLLFKSDELNKLFLLKRI